VSQSYRQGLAIFDEGLFLNYAATAPLSRRVRQKMQAAVEDMKQPLGQYFYQALNQLEFCRRDFAELVGAQAREIAFATNTSSAVSTIAMALPWQDGDKVLVADNEFPSNYYPWQNLKNRGVTCEKFHPQKDVPIVETLKKTNLKNVRLIALSAVSFETGRLYELEDFCRFCKERDIFSFVDAIQAIGAVEFSVQKTGADFMASGAQKWLMGPVGCGLIYARREHLPRLHVPYVGWTSVKYPEYFDLETLEYPDEMTRFEPGLPNYLSILGCGESLSELKELGWQNIYQRIKGNRNFLASHLQEQGLELLTGATDDSAGIVSFRLPQGWTHRDTETAYTKEKIKITTRRDYVRVSAHFFNEKKELEIFLKATEKIFHTKKGIGFSVAADRKPEIKISSSPRMVMITGAAGALGKAMAVEILKKGQPLHLVDVDGVGLQKFRQEMREKFSSVSVHIDEVDFSSEENFSRFLTKLLQTGKKSYTGLIHCAGFLEAGLFRETRDDILRQTFEVNALAPIRLMRVFLNELIDTSEENKALGILNIVSSTGRCGSPLLASYGAANAALWTLSESLGRELEGKIPVTTFVAPAMHSPLQKRMGRVALRHFKVGKTFDYEVIEDVAAEALKTFLQRKTVHLSGPTRMKTFINVLWPELVQRKIAQAWRK
jgi:selenocysteine lyase/cysteine desulfurase/short-subunit dehydrogenase